MHDANGYQWTRAAGRADFIDVVADARLASHPYFTVVDLGDVRIVLRRSLHVADFLGQDTGRGSIVIDSNKPRELDGMHSGGGGGGSQDSFFSDRNLGVTHCRLNDVAFDIDASTLHFNGVDVRMGDGKKAVRLGRNGDVESVVHLD